MKKIGVLVPHFDDFGRCFYNLFTEINLVRRNLRHVTPSRPQNEVLLLDLKILLT